MKTASASRRWHKVERHANRRTSNRRAENALAQLGAVLADDARRERRDRLDLQRLPANETCFESAGGAPGAVRTSCAARAAQMRRRRCEEQNERRFGECRRRGACPRGGELPLRQHSRANCGRRRHATSSATTVVAWPPPKRRNQVALPLTRCLSSHRSCLCLSSSSYLLHARARASALSRISAKRDAALSSSTSTAGTMTILCNNYTNTRNWRLRVSTRRAP